MEDKYYTPDISELYIGFELEHKNPMQENIWKREIVDSDMWGIAYCTYEENQEDYPNEIRVRYLDKSDIEELGWDFIEYDTAKYKNYYIEFNPEHFTYIYEKRIYEDLILFRGKIKNKSELKKLMSQLGING